MCYYLITYPFPLSRKKQVIKFPALLVFPKVWQSPLPATILLSYPHASRVALYARERLNCLWKWVVKKFSTIASLFANIHEIAFTHRRIKIEPVDYRLGQVCFKRLNSRNKVMNWLLHLAKQPWKGPIRQREVKPHDAQGSMRRESPEGAKKKIRLSVCWSGILSPQSSLRQDAKNAKIFRRVFLRPRRCLRHLPDDDADGYCTSSQHEVP